ncbi:MAG: iron-containing alcohol dehydrogenase [Solirubrobacterales bacterium]|nr:iron-containing alcohol dehydrogenase [Solirubrobacterales bacterium]
MTCARRSRPIASGSTGGGSGVARSPAGRALVFIGFMGAGKSTAAAAARGAGLEVVDTDARLERELGCSIAEFFDRHGEPEFRRREEALAGELLERADGGAIALGGGSVLSERVRAALERHVVVWLRVGAEDAWGRVDDSRPLARDRPGFESLLAEREPIYEELADAVLPAADLGTVERAMPALLGLRELAAGTRMAWAASASGEYPAYVGRGLLETSPLDGAARYGGLGAGGRAFCVTDATVGELYAKRLEPLAGRIEVSPGEGAKTLAEAERVLRELARLGATRSDHVLALGGGVVGDLAGFCAATYQRGIGVVQVPTTLVAQVDSAYGGKTGVDLPEAKNYVGAYHLPRAVLADPATLATLPAGELAAGFVEVLKTALIRGGALWERARTIEAPLDPTELDDLIFACVLTKLEVVAADERDSGARAALNLGHTVGHAIEAASGYARYRHGEAIGLGLLAALRLSGAGELREEVGSILGRHELPVALDPGIAVDEVLAPLERDKKRTAAGVGFVLCERPGEVVTARTLDAGRVRAAVEELRRPADGAR